MPFSHSKNCKYKSKPTQEMPGSFPKISVEMGCYNFERYIAEAIESVLAQTLKPFELIISDDHSTDSSWEIIQSFQKKYPDLIRCFRTLENLGMKKCGIMRKDMVRGNLLSTIDGDDRWLPRKLELEWEALKKYPEAKLAYSNVYLINEFGERISVWYDGNGEPPPSGDVFVQTFAKQFFKNNRSVFRNHLVYYDVLKEIGYKDLDDNLMHPDWDKKIRITAKYQVAYSGDALVEYRVHDSGIHRTRAKDLFESTSYIIQKNMHLLESRTPEEQKFVLDNLKTLLVQDYNFGKKFESEKVITGENANLENEHIYKGENLIFLISQPRGGSTLLQRILNGNSEIYTIAEPWIMLHPLYALKKNGVFAEFDSNLARQGLEDFLSQVPEGQELYYRALRNMTGTLYNRALEVSGKKFFLDKTPRYHFIVPELKKVFPEAKFIFLLRNPLAVLSSTLKTWFQNNPESLKKSLNYLDVIKGPLNLIQGIQLLNEKAVVVRYEELVEDAEITVKAICYKLGIGFQQEMLAYGTRPKPEGRFGDSVGIVKHHGAVPYYIDQWAQNLQSPQLYDFSLEYISALGPEIFNLMGYPYEENINKLNQLENLSRPGNEQARETSNSPNETCSTHQALEDQIKMLETIIKQNPHDARSHNDLGVLYYQMGEKQKVLSHYQEAVRLNPDNRIFAKNLADFYYVEMKNIEAALQIYNKVLQTAPDDTETLMILGFISEDLEKFEEAKNYFGRVLEIDPHNQKAHQHINIIGNRNFENKLSARV